MNTFQKVLKDYLMVETVEQAKGWAKKQACSSHRKAQFVEEVKDAIENDNTLYQSADRCMDYIDSLRRAPYVGLGI